MTTDRLTMIILFAGFNEVVLPKAATLHHIQIKGYEVSLFFTVDRNAEIEYRQFYVAFNNEPTDHDQGILRLLKTVQFPDGTSTAMVYEVYPYEQY